MHQPELQYKRIKSFVTNNYYQNKYLKRIPSVFPKNAGLSPFTRR